MKKSTKKKVLIAAGVVAAILLFPVPVQYLDGGSVTYKAILYSVTDWHEMTGLNSDGKTTYVEGLSIEILGIEVFDNWSLVSH